MNRIAGRVQRAQAVEDHAVGVGGGGGQALSEKVQRQRPIREGSSDEEAERSSANTPTKAPSPLPGMESSARRPAAGDLRWKHTAEVFTVARAGADARAPAPRQQVPVLEGNMSPPPATPLRQPSPQCCVACAVLWRVRGGALEPPWHTRRSRPLYRESEKSLATDVWGAVCTGVRLTVLALERAGRLYFMATPLPPSASGVHFFTMDNQMRYAPFCDDFGPFNLGMTHHFCQVLKDLLCQRRLDNTKICYYTSTGQNDLTNAIFLLGAFMVIHLDVHPEQAWQPFGKFASVIRPYRDATWCPSPYDLSLLHCWQAVRKAMRCNLYHPDTFDAEEYFYYDHPSNGDMHEVVKSKFFAFKGPTDRPEKYYTKRPLDYVDVFKAKKIKGVVRLNNKQYDARLLERHGFQHHDLFFTDCSTPSDAIVEKFLRLSEETEGSLAVHCLAGLGRTVCVCLCVCVCVCPLLYTASLASATVYVCVRAETRALTVMECVSGDADSHVDDETLTFHRQRMHRLASHRASG
jgi:protein-tyrosine phosphatase